MNNNLRLVVNNVNDKKLEDVLPLFPKAATYYFCKPNIPRGLCQKELQQKALSFGLKGSEFDSVNKALKTAIKNSSVKDCIFVGGSTFVVAGVI